MKKASIVFCYIGLFLNVVLLIANIIFLVNSIAKENLIYINDLITIIFSLISIPLCFIVVMKVKGATSKDKLIVWGVLALIFVNVISGILILCIKEEELKPVENKIIGTNGISNVYNATSSKVIENPTAKQNADAGDAYTRLMSLKHLFEEGLITEEEYKEKRQQFIDKF